jgi:hypothetical protein
MASTSTDGITVTVATMPVKYLLCFPKDKPPLEVVLFL